MTKSRDRARCNVNRQILGGFCKIRVDANEASEIRSPSDAIRDYRMRRGIRSWHGEFRYTAATTLMETY